MTDIQRLSLILSLAAAVEEELNDEQTEKVIEFNDILLKEICSIYNLNEINESIDFIEEEVLKHTKEVLFNEMEYFNKKHGKEEITNG